MPPRKQESEEAPKESQPIMGIPKNSVGNVVQNFIDSGISELSVEEQDDGRFKVTPIA